MTDTFTTRETADHAELAAMKPEDHRVRAVMLACESRMKGYETPIHAADAKFALDYLLSEIAALRGDLTETRVAADLLVSSVRADLRQAERQRDEARAVIKDVDRASRQAASMNDAGYTVTVERTATHIYGITAAFLANQGADK